MCMYISMRWVEEDTHVINVISTPVQSIQAIRSCIVPVSPCTWLLACLCPGQWGWGWHVPRSGYEHDVTVHRNSYRRYRRRGGGGGREGREEKCEGVYMQHHVHVHTYTGAHEQKECQTKANMHPAVTFWTRPYKAIQVMPLWLQATAITVNMILLKVVVMLLLVWNCLLIKTFT